MRHRFFRGLKAVLLAGLMAASLIPAGAQPAAAQDEKPPALVVRQTAAGVQIDYTAQNGALPTLQLGDVLLPGRQVLVEVTGNTAMSAMQAGVQSSLAIQSAPFSGELQLAAVPRTESADGAAAGDIQREPVIDLPDSPVSVVNESYMRGRRLATLAITPLFEQGGQRQMASAFSVTLPNMRLIDDPTSLMSDFMPAMPPQDGKFVPQAEDNVTCDNTYQPANAALADGQPRWRVRMTQSGIVQVSFSTLNAAGMPVVAMSRIEVTNPKGQVVALHRSDPNGAFDGADWIRFYAPPPGDRWNAFDTYWVAIKDAGSPNMGAPVAGTGAGAPKAFERGVFVANKLYDSTLPGTDGDHWFAANLRPFGGTSGIWAFTPPTRLPPTGENATVQVAFASSTGGTHALQLATNGNSNFVNPANSMAGVGAFTATFQIPFFQGATQFAARPIGMPEVIMPDRVVWEQPIALNLGGNGAAFAIKGAAGNVQMNASPAETLYEVTNPVAPAIAPNSNGLFGHPGGDRHYVMAGNGTLVTNGSISAYTPAAMNSAFNKNVVYIAPNSLLSTLQSHINFRNASGYQAGSFSAENIYDWWSFGQMSPVALRNFLRHAYCTWSVKPFSLTMVGDGSADPFDYNGYNTGDFAGTNVTLIPPYLAPVDPFLVPAGLGAAETACDACYAQLNGANPLEDKLPDLLFGRIPAKNAAELGAALGKLFVYETAPALTSGGDAGWRNIIAYVNDNSRLPNGNFDPAGNFEAATEQSIGQQPAWARINRMYYDPFSGVTDSTRTSNPNVAFERTFNLFNRGVGIINYTGHGSIIQMAVLEPGGAGNKPYLFSLYDVPDLKNTGRLPLLLQFTCLTSAFQTPVQFYGATVDERLMLSPNGPPAIWGPTSLAVGFSHDALMRGFYKTLWSQPTFRTTIGVAAQGGYIELFATAGNTPNVDNLLRTYMIMGDPVTRAYVGRVYQQNTPLILRTRR
jgi:hypothetical protein